MGGSLFEKDITVNNILSYLNYLHKNVKDWEKGQRQNIGNIRVPDLSNSVRGFFFSESFVLLKAINRIQSVANVGIMQLISDQEKKEQEQLALERQKHRGFPQLKSIKNVCTRKTEVGRDAQKRTAVHETDSYGITSESIYGG